MDFLKLDSLKAKLAAMRSLNVGELKRLRDDFNIEFTYDTNAIEGSTLTLRETALILQEGVTIAEKPLRMHLDAIGHRDAFDFVVKAAETSDKLTERQIKEIHSLVLMCDNENKGVYRNVPVTIQGALHAPLQPYLIASQMETLIIDYEKMKCEKHIIEAISEFHLRFEDIHPFIDGNGRTGRLIINLELIKAGFLPINIKFADKLKYYACFDEYFKSEPRKPDALTKLILKYEIEEIEKRVKDMGGK